MIVLVIDTKLLLSNLIVGLFYHVAKVKLVSGLSTYTMNEEAQEWMDNHYAENRETYELMARADPDRK